MKYTLAWTFEQNGPLYFVFLCFVPVIVLIWRPNVKRKLRRKLKKTSDAPRFDPVDPKTFRNHPGAPDARGVTLNLAPPQGLRRLAW